MKPIIHSLVAFATTALIVLPVHAADISRESIKAKAEEAAAYFEEHGLAATKAAFEDQAGPWATSDFVYWVQNVNGVLEVHSTLPQYTGIDTSPAKDADGKEFVKETIAVESTAWITFKWQAPGSDTISDLTVYNIRVGDFVVAAAGELGQ